MIRLQWLCVTTEGIGARIDVCRAGDGGRAGVGGGEGCRGWRCAVLSRNRMARLREVWWSTVNGVATHRLSAVVTTRTTLYAIIPSLGVSLPKLCCSQRNSEFKKSWQGCCHLTRHDTYVAYRNAPLLTTYSRTERVCAPKTKQFQRPVCVYLNLNIGLRKI